MLIMNSTLPYALIFEMTTEVFSSQIESPTLQRTLAQTKLTRTRHVLASMNGKDNFPASLRTRDRAKPTLKSRTYEVKIIAVRRGEIRRR